MNTKNTKKDPLTTNCDTHSLYLLGYALSLSITILTSQFTSQITSVITAIVGLGLFALASDFYYTVKNNKTKANRAYEILRGGVTASIIYSVVLVILSFVH